LIHVLLGVFVNILKYEGGRRRATLAPGRLATQTEPSEIEPPPSQTEPRPSGSGRPATHLD
jgi:hypothetical protein